MDTPPQTSGSWKPGCSNSWLLCLKAWLGDFLLDAYLLPNQLKRLSSKMGSSS